MRRIPEELREIRVPPESLARWALETAAPAQEATCAALTFLVHTEHAAATLLPVPTILQLGKAIQDPDGFSRLPRSAEEHFRSRSQRALAWMELFLFFRERFPEAARREPSQALYSLAQAFARHDDATEAAVDLLVRECVLPEIEEQLQRTLTYPPLLVLLKTLRETDPQRSVDARRLSAQVLGELSGKRLWAVRKRLVASATRAVLGARPIFDELERGGMKVDRTRAARGFARRLEEAVSELAGTRVLPANLLARLAGAEEEPSQAVPAVAIALPADAPP